MVRQALAMISGLMVLAGAAWAGPAPAELPPRDFTGAQYIDSRGCVFSRADDGWVARLDGSGAVICGYPPSLDIRAAGSAGFAPDPGEVPPPPPPMEEALAKVLASGLQDGELIGDQRERQERLAVPTPSPRRGPAADLPELVETIPRVQAQLAAAGGMTAGSSRLCALLGYDAAGKSLPGLGVDATRGYCRGATMGLPSPVLTGIGTGRAGADESAGTKTATASDDAATARAKPVSAQVAPGTGARPATSSPRAPAKKPTAPVRSARHEQDNSATPASPQVEMVPHWARYVMLGRYDDADRADAALRAAAALGYPVARSRKPADADGGRMVLAGPFADRRDLIAALNDLRRRGYTGAVAR